MEGIMRLNQDQSMIRMKEQKKRNEDGSEEEEESEVSRVESMVVEIGY